MMEVIVSTHNRVKTLKDALDSFLQQNTCGGLDYEIVVVDNNSADLTAELVKSYIPKFNGRLKYIFEHRQGKTFALNTAIAKTKASVLVFTDDDVIADPDWLRNLYICFNKFQCDAVGGRIVPLYDHKVPGWVKKYQHLLAGPLVSYDYGTENKQFDAEKMRPYFGANWACRRDCFDRLGFFREDMGPGVGSMREDTEFCHRMIKSGMKLYYSGKARVKHQTSHKKFTVTSLLRWHFVYGKSEALQLSADISKKYKTIFGAPRFLFRSILDNTVLLLINFFNPEKIIYCGLRISEDMGRIVYYRSLKYNQGC